MSNSDQPLVGTILTHFSIRPRDFDRFGCQLASISPPQDLPTSFQKSILEGIDLLLEICIDCLLIFGLFSDCLVISRILILFLDFGDFIFSFRFNKSLKTFTYKTNLNNLKKSLNFPKSHLLGYRVDGRVVGGGRPRAEGEGSASGWPCGGQRSAAVGGGRGAAEKSHNNPK